MGIATPPPSPRESLALSAVASTAAAAAAVATALSSGAVAAATGVAARAAPAVSAVVYPGQRAVDVADAQLGYEPGVTASRFTVHPAASFSQRATAIIMENATQRAAALLDPRIGTKTALTGHREGHFKKDPTLEHKNAMMRHVSTCQSVDCHRTWTGPWGCFIGGSDGRTHFSLTECTEGKILNELLGWDYENPPC